MSNDEVASGQGPLPYGDSSEPVPEPAADPEAEHDGFDAGDWGADVADALSDPIAANLFTDEIEHVDASDWDVDTALIWGDEVDDQVVDDGGDLGLDFPL